MKHITDHIRDRLMSTFLPADDEIGRHAHESINSIIDRKRGSDFDRKCNNRLIIGTYRYEDGGKYDAVGSAIKRLTRYHNGDHNQEYLVDAANLCRVEYDNPLYDDVYFDAADDGEHAGEIK